MEIARRHALWVLAVLGLAVCVQACLSSGDGVADTSVVEAGAGDLSPASRGQDPPKLDTPPHPQRQAALAYLPDRPPLYRLDLVRRIPAMGKRYAPWLEGTEPRRGDGPDASQPPTDVSEPPPDVSEPPADPTLAPAIADLTFTDVTAAAGLTLEGAGFSVAWGDLDGDNDADVVVPASFSNQVVVYRNDGGTFNVSGLYQHGGVPFSASIGDYDNDGVADFVAGGAAKVVLYRGVGNGTFAPVQEWSLVGSSSSMVGLYDMDNDGLLDIYVALTPGSPPPWGPKYKQWCQNPCSVPALEPPNYYAKDKLILQGPNGSWNDISNDVPHSDPWWTLAFAFAHWLPGDKVALYAGNDSTPDGFWAMPPTPDSKNLMCDAKLTECIGTMGVLPADFNRDGLLDILLTNWSHHIAYVNKGDGTFANDSDALGFTSATKDLVGWGAAAADFDNDADIDLVIGNAPPPGKSSKSAGKQRPLFLFNHGGAYHSLHPDAGFPWLQWVGDTYGVQTADYDMDADVDFLFVEPLGRLWLFRNDSAQKGHFIKLLLRGTTSNRMAIGTLVRVTIGGVVLVQENLGPSGASGMNETILHFGLGPATEVDQVSVKFPSGKEVVFGPVGVDAGYEVVEP